jgi:hypothetical protein
MMSSFQQIKSTYQLNHINLSVYECGESLGQLSIKFNVMKVMYMGYIQDNAT